MKEQIVISFVILILLSSACSLFQKESFEGKWELKLNGGIEEVFVFEISANNDFSFTRNVEYQGNSYEVTIKGNVTKEGIFTADLIAMGQRLGSVDGMLTFENGFGKWDASYVNGTWAALKK